MREKMKHSDVKREAILWCGINGWSHISINAGPFSEEGISDLIIIKNNRVVFVECKTAKDTQLKGQKRFQEKVESAGGEYLIIRKYEDLDILKTCINHIKEVRGDSYPYVCNLDSSDFRNGSGQSRGQSRAKGTKSGYRKKA